MELQFTGFRLLWSFGKRGFIDSINRKLICKEEQVGQLSVLARGLIGTPFCKFYFAKSWHIGDKMRDIFDFDPSKCGVMFLALSRSRKLKPTPHCRFVENFRQLLS